VKQENIGAVTPGGSLDHRRVRDLGELVPAPLFWRLRQAWKARKELPMRTAQVLLGQVKGTLQFKSELRGVIYRVNWDRLAPWQVEKLRELMRNAKTGAEALGFAAHFGGEGIDCGVLSRKYVTNAGVAWIVDCFQNTYEAEIMKYHALGTGTNAENVTDTTLQTEITATHYTSSNRPFDSAADGASANILKLIGTHTQATAGDTIAEDGIVSTISGAYVLLDRSQFTGVPLAVSDSFVTTYNLTLTAGG
jgi:hypothetical protein